MIMPDAGGGYTPKFKNSKKKIGEYKNENYGREVEAS